MGTFNAITEVSRINWSVQKVIQICHWLNRSIVGVSVVVDLVVDKFVVVIVVKVDIVIELVVELGIEADANSVVFTGDGWCRYWTLRPVAVADIIWEAKAIEIHCNVNSTNCLQRISI